ncbi:MAG: hypothetical protein E4H30_07570 [Methanomassiliicoccus sp.]|nr:MAG: hypothetical protein E4H30_07570 [Methanomassiliicoccus sp.]
MSISITAPAVEVPYIDVRKSPRKYKVQNNISIWKKNLGRVRREALNNARHLHEVGKHDHGPNVAEVYQGNKIQHLINIESTLVIICIIIAGLSAIGTVFVPILIIITIVSAWIASIVYRFYMHHKTCYNYLLELNAQRCPYCHKALIVQYGKSIKSS